MKKRFLAFLLALSIAASLLVMPASAAGSNAAVQAAVALGGMTTEQAAQSDTPPHPRPAGPAAHRLFVLP